ncbi:MAG: hypothetical protein KJ571_07260 [Bacteroidetes bacterium]|nr:hypothetical protein [Bacteroidota bacterium]
MDRMKYYYFKAKAVALSRDNQWKFVYIFLFLQSVFVTLSFYWFTKVFE